MKGVLCWRSHQARAAAGGLERASTTRQGASGLGMAAQRKAIDDYPSNGVPRSSSGSRGTLTRRGGPWPVSTVMNLLERLGLLGGAMRQLGHSWPTNEAVGRG